MTTPTPPPEPADELIARLQQLISDPGFCVNGVAGKRVADAIDRLTSQQRELAELREAHLKEIRFSDKRFQHIQTLAEQVNNLDAELAELRRPTTSGETPWTNTFLTGEHVAHDAMWIAFSRTLERELAAANARVASRNAVTAEEWNACLLEKDHLRTELARVTAERDEAVKAHGFVWNAARKAAQYFRWAGCRDTSAIEAMNQCCEAEKLTPKWSTDWVIVTPLELHLLKQQADKNISNARITSLETALAAAQADKEKKTVLLTQGFHSYEACALCHKPIDQKQYDEDMKRQDEMLPPMARLALDAAAATPPGAKEGGKTL